MVKLQSSEIDLDDVRKLFDSVIKAFPSMAGYLASDAAIVHSPQFEQAAVKLIRRVCHVIIIIIYFYCDRFIRILILRKN